jgi:hypothetical protein
MLKKSTSYEFSQEGLQQMIDDNKRNVDVSRLYKVMITSVAGIFIIFLV